MKFVAFSEFKAIIVQNESDALQQKHRIASMIGEIRNVGRV